MAKKFVLQLLIDGNATPAIQAMDKVEKKVKHTGLISQRAIGSFLGNYAVDTMHRITNAISGGIGAVVDYSDRIEQLGVGLESLLGSADAAERLLSQVQDLSLRTPFQFDALADMAQRLRAAGVEADNLLPLIEDIGAVVAATGAVTTDRLEGVNVALSQIISKGRLSAEEMEQLAERQIPGWKILSEYLDINQRTLRKLSEEGKVSSAVMVEALQAIARTKFGDAVARQTRTLSGSLGVIKNAILISSREMMKPLYDAARDFSAEFAKNIRQNQGQAKGVMFSFGETLGDYFRRGFSKGAGQGRNDLIAAITGTVVMSPGLFLGASAIDQLTKGIDEGLNKKVTSGFLDWFQKHRKTIEQEMSEEAKFLKEQAALMAEEADKDRKRLIESLTKQIFELTAEYEYFGDKSRALQKAIELQGMGVDVLNDRYAQHILRLSALLDLKEEEAKATEQVAKWNESVVEQIEALRFAGDPIALLQDQVDTWVASLDENLKEKLNPALKELNGNLQELSDRTTNAALRDAFKRFGDSVKETVKSLAPVAEDVKSVFLETINDISREWRDVVKADDFSEGLFSIFTKGTKEEQFAQFTKYITSLDTVGGGLIGTTFDLTQAFEKFHEIYKAVEGSISRKKMEKGLTDLDGILANLGLSLGGYGFKSGMQQVEEFLGNPDNSAALEAIANLAKMTVDEVKELIRQAQLAKELIDSGIMPKNRPEDEGGFLDGIIGGIEERTEGIATITDSLKTLGQVAGEVFDQFAQGIGAMVADWVLMGDQADISMRKMVASVLAGLAQQAAVYAVYATALGLLRLAQWDFAAAGNAFASAAVWAGIAVGAALVGRAVAGDSFQRQSGATSGSAVRDDYIPAIGSNYPGSSLSSTVGQLASAVNNLDNKISSMKPGDVVTAGVKSARSFVTERIVEDLRKNTGRKNRMGYALGLT